MMTPADPPATTALVETIRHALDELRLVTTMTSNVASNADAALTALAGRLREMEQERVRLVEQVGSLQDEIFSLECDWKDHECGS